MDTTNEAVPTSPTRHRHVAAALVGTVIGVIVLAVIVVAVSLGVSYAAVQEHAENLQVSVAEMSEAADSLDIERLVEAARTVPEDAAALKSELDGFQWSVAAACTPYGDDIRAARQVAFVADSLSTNLLTPLIGIADGYANGLSSIGLAILFDSELAAQVEDVLDAAGPTIREADSIINEIPETGIAELNQAVEALRVPLDEATEALDTYGSLTSLLL
jgi:hypothetical protein